MDWNEWFNNYKTITKITPPNMNKKEEKTMKIIDIGTKFARKIVEKVVNRILKQKLGCKSVKIQLKQFCVTDFGEDSNDISIELNGKITMSKEDFIKLIG